MPKESITGSRIIYREVMERGVAFRPLSRFGRPVLAWATPHAMSWRKLRYLLRGSSRSGIVTARLTVKPSMLQRCPTSASRKSPGLGPQECLGHRSREALWCSAVRDSKNRGPMRGVLLWIVLTMPVREHSGLSPREHRKQPSATTPA